MIYVTGADATKVKAARLVTVTLHSKNDNVYRYVDIEMLMPQLDHSVPITLKTQGGKYEASVIGLPEHMGTIPVLYSGDFYISPKDMDKLLSSPVDIYIDMK